MGDGGKGSQQRPTDKKKFDEGYERIFGKKDDEHLTEVVKERQGGETIKVNIKEI